MIHLKIIVVGVITMVLLDLLGIGLLMGSFYKSEIGSFLRLGVDGGLQPRITPTILVYTAATIILMLFVLPVIRTSMADGHNIFVAALWGALTGFLLYSFYDLTNLALFKDWKVLISIVDIIWGTILFYITTLVLLLI